MKIDEPTSTAIKQDAIAVDKVALRTKPSRWHTKGKLFSLTFVSTPSHRTRRVLLLLCLLLYRSTLHVLCDIQAQYK